MIIKENFKKNPRLLAVYMLNRLETGNFVLDSLIDENEAKINQLSHRDKSLFFSILYGVLRKKGNLDKIIQRHSKKRIDKIDKPVINIIRIAVFQIVYLEKIPHSAAVNTSVDMSKSIGFKSASGFVNAVLRNFLKDFDEEKYFKYEKNRNDFPKWMVSRWDKAFTKYNTEKLCSFFNSTPKITLRVNTVKTTKKDLIALLSPQVDSITEEEFTKTAISINKPKQRIANLPGFKQGLFQIQDMGAQIIAPVLSIKKNEKIMDACAGLGGKTGHLAQLSQGKSDITAVDISQDKLALLKTEMLRLGFSNCVKTRVMNLTEKHDPALVEFFDKILIDAPCSGLGVLRRNPDTKWKRTLKDIKQLASNQKKILFNTSKMLKKGGMILYCVCSLEPEETTEVINDFLEANKRFSKVDISSLVDETLMDEEKNLKLIPFISGTDGFFASLLKKG